MSLGTLEIKFRESKIYIRRNWLYRLMGHKLKYTKQTILFAFEIYQQKFLIPGETCGTPDISFPIFIRKEIETRKLERKSKQQISRLNGLYRLNNIISR